MQFGNYGTCAGLLAMHILFLSDNFPPEVNAPASRTFEHCREWVKEGCEVTVVTCVPNFPRGQIYAGYRHRLWQSEWMDGIRVIRVWSFITANEGFVLRIMDYLSFMVASIVATVFIKNVDVVVGTSPQFFTACAARVVAATKRIPFVFEVRDLWPESIKAVGAMRDSFVLKMMEGLEAYLYRKADAIVSVTRSFKLRIAERGIDGGKIHVITNGVDLTRFEPRAKDPVLVAELGLAGKIVVGYIGTLGMAHALETVLDAARLVRADPAGARVHFLFLGDGARRQHLETYALANDLDNVSFLHSVPKSDVVRFWSILDISVIHLRRTDLFRSVIPSKIFESMAMGIPLLLGVGGEAAALVEREGVGRVFEPENARALTERLFQMASEPGLWSRLKARGPAAAANYDRKTLAGEMLDILRATAGAT